VLALSASGGCVERRGAVLWWHSADARTPIVPRASREMWHRWHVAFGHVKGDELLERLEVFIKVIDGEAAAKLIQCNACVLWRLRWGRGRGRHWRHRSADPAGARAWDELVIDVMTLERDRGLNLVLVLVCTATSFAAAQPLKDNSAPVVIRALHRVFQLFGPPSCVRSDNALNFASSATVKYLRIMGTSWAHGAARSKGATAIAERKIRTLRRALMSTPKWVDELQTAIMASNTTPLAVDGVTPFELFFGRRLGELHRRAVAGVLDTSERLVAWRRALVVHAAAVEEERKKWRDGVDSAKVDMLRLGEPVWFDCGAKLGKIRIQENWVPAIVTKRMVGGLIDRYEVELESGARRDADASVVVRRYQADPVFESAMDEALKEHIEMEQRWETEDEEVWYAVV
jgi:hypothetical protein